MPSSCSEDFHCAKRNAVHAFSESGNVSINHISACLFTAGINKNLFFKLKEGNFPAAIFVKITEQVIDCRTKIGFPPEIVYWIYFVDFDKSFIIRRGMIFFCFFKKSFKFTAFNQQVDFV